MDSFFSINGVCDKVRDWILFLNMGKGSETGSFLDTLWKWELPHSATETKFCPIYDYQKRNGLGSRSPWRFLNDLLCFVSQR